MAKLSTYGLKNLNKDKIIIKEYFTDAYVEEVFEWENIITSTTIWLWYYMLKGKWST